MLSALSLTLVMGISPAPSSSLQKPLSAQCPAKVAGQLKRPAPSEAKSGKNILVNAQALQVNAVTVNLCPIPLAQAQPLPARQKIRR